VIRARGITQFYSRWRKYSTSLFVHQSPFTTYMKPTVTNKCIHSRRTTIAANNPNPARRKALPNRRIDKPPLAYLLCAPAKILPQSLPPTLDNQTPNRISLPRPDIRLPQRSLTHSLRAPELQPPRVSHRPPGQKSYSQLPRQKDTVLRTPTSAHQAYTFRSGTSDGFLISADVYRRGRDRSKSLPGSPSDGRGKDVVVRGVQSEGGDHCCNQVGRRGYAEARD